MGPVYKYPSNILFDATKMGNTLFVIELLRAYPTLTWMRNDDGVTIFHVAAMHRHLGIYNILYDIRARHAITSLIDVNGNTMLHLIGMTSKKMREETSRASLFMQRELLWFTIVAEIEKTISLN
ncbi:LOW QUALITY PROTEIN: hypothetical protein OSB04_017561 [Centaurea solstitialis]|uniref:Uncharacterized protein n=1 Tax=Centaurea solstitialis TaxID=347529 RepID=A0AA38TGA8_9ASTR|nr:LOW QUALITY PROTEIN: hypothetical protein OSB04_017561 [Centaurea solstitialis]